MQASDAATINKRNKEVSGENISVKSGDSEDDDPGGKPLQHHYDYTQSDECNSLTILKKYFSNASVHEWNSWQWQIRNSITSYDDLEKIFGYKFTSMEIIEKKLPFRITPYYAGVVFHSKKLEKAVIPSLEEMICSPGESCDPLHEENDSPVHNIVHRYPDRALFLATSFCSTNCRYCTRSRIVGNNEFNKKRKEDWDKAIDYIQKTPQIRDVIISGGDPLTLTDESLEYILSRLKAIPHVEMLRLGTKAPVVLPMRITRKLTRILKKYHPLYVSIHFTHPDELTPEVNNACSMLADAGMPLGSQTVLLKDINDDPVTMKNLFHKLLSARVKPYYMYQCDPIIGSSHFRTPVSRGLEIIEALRGWTSGYAIPQYVIDAPGGGGKIPLLPDYYQGKDSNGNIILKNYENKNFYYYDIV